MIRNILFLFACAIVINVNAQVAINNVAASPDNSAMLDVNSTTMGLLIPRMSVAQRDAIVNPATGLMIYCTDDNLYYSNGGAPEEPYWLAVNSKWVFNGSNIYYAGGHVGIGTASPSAVLDITGENNWDLINGDGDFRLGNSLYKIRMGIALEGGGAGAAGIMQYGQSGGYNVLKLGAQGNYLLYLNGESQRIGIGTDSPLATLDVQGSLRVADGTQGAGKVLVSDAVGNASWTAQVGVAHSIGESFGGGIVISVTTNGLHGIVAETQDQATNCTWIFAQDNISMQSNHSTAGQNFLDWRLPTKYELNLMYTLRSLIGGFTDDYYWSSSQASDVAWSQYFLNGNQYQDYVGEPSSIRAVRAF